jgi:glyoxylase-like metal-dependent hydrolase (beta-lactamase superfamily II)
LHEQLGLQVHASPLTAQALATGDEDIVSLTAIKAAGLIPGEYRLRACSARGDLIEGQAFRVGRLTITPFDTPGHCRGHVSLLVEGGDRRYLLGGDLVFFGGAVSLQNIPDCSIQECSASIAKIAKVAFDALLPGHLSISLRNGNRHVDAANAAFGKLAIPSN